MKIFSYCLLLLVFTLHIALADTPPPNSVKIKDSAGNALTSTGGALDVNVASTAGNLAKETGGNLASILTELGVINAKLNSLGQKNMAGSVPVTIASDQAAINVNGSFTASSGTAGQPANSTSVGTGSAATFAPPANCLGFILEAESSNTDNIRWALGSTSATSTVGVLAEPGRDTGYIPGCATLSAISLNGTQTVSVMWVLR